MFSAGDFLVRIGRYFDRMAVDTRLTFEEWTPPDGSSYVINATEIRGVNFTMTPTETTPPPPQPRRSGRHVVEVVETPDVPRPKEFTMDQQIDDTIQARCW